MLGSSRISNPQPKLECDGWTHIAKYKLLWLEVMAIWRILMGVNNLFMVKRSYDHLKNPNGDGKFNWIIHLEEVLSLWFFLGMKIWWISCCDNEDFMRKKKKRKRKSPFDFTSLQMNLMVFVLDWSGFFTRSKKKKKRKRKRSSFDFNLVMNLMVGFSWGYTHTTMLINTLAIFKNCLLLWHLSIQEPNQNLNLSFSFHPLVALHCTGLQFKIINSSSVLCLLVIMTCPEIIVFSSICKYFWNCIFFVEQFSKHPQCSM